MLKVATPEEIKRAEEFRKKETPADRAAKAEIARKNPQPATSSLKNEDVPELQPDYVSKGAGATPSSGDSGKAMKKGGKVSSASSRADGIAQRGKTKGTLVACGGGYMKGKK